jgi:hypothetical protein
VVGAGGDAGHGGVATPGVGDRRRLRASGGEFRRSSSVPVTQTVSPGSTAGSSSPLTVAVHRARTGRTPATAGSALPSVPSSGPSGARAWPPPLQETSPPRPAARRPRGRRAHRQPMGWSPPPSERARGPRPHRHRCHARSRRGWRPGRAARRPRRL